VARYRVEMYVDARGRSRLEDWLEDLSAYHRALALRLIKRLEEQGPDIRPPVAKPLAHLEAPIWELRHPSGLRIYYWREGMDRFVVAAGELKQQDRPDPRLLAWVVRAYHESRRREVN
jgi:putative component of toxin-antitoxin plasmid stabilization module